MSDKHPAARSEKDIRRCRRGGAGFQQRHGLRGQRHAMRPARSSSAKPGWSRPRPCRRSRFCRSAPRISISSHVMPRTSPERAAVSVRNCSACAAMPSRWASRPTSGHVAQRKGGLIVALRHLRGLGQHLRQVAFPRAGLSPARCPATVAHDSTFSILPAQPRGGFRLVVPDGFQHAQHVLHRDLRDQLRPQHRRRVAVQRRAPLLLVLFVPKLRQLRGRYLSTASAKVSPARALRLSASGSPPSIALPRFSSASLRASTSGTAGGLPRPSSHRLPRMVMRCTHCLAPFFPRAGKSPCPSKYLPGSVTVSTKRAESAFSGLLIFSRGMASPIASPTQTWIASEYVGTHAQ
jgi:hypothetical protein